MHDNQSNSDNDFNLENEQFIARLARVPAAAVTLDPQVVFYQAGFAAAMAQNRIRMRRLGTIACATATAASLAVLCVVATLAYRAGDSAARNDLLAQMNAIRHDETLESSKALRPDQHAQSHSGLDSEMHSEKPRRSNSHAPAAGSFDASPVVAATTSDGSRTLGLWAESAWWSFGLPPQLVLSADSQGINYTKDSPPISLVGLGAWKQQRMDARNAYELPVEAGSPARQVDASPMNSSRPLQPRDWTSVLPLL